MNEEMQGVMILFFLHVLTISTDENTCIFASLTYASAISNYATIRAFLSVSFDLVSGIVTSTFITSK